MESDRLVEFKKLAELHEKLRSTSSRNAKVAMIAEFLRSLSAREAVPAIVMLTGRRLPGEDDSKVMVGWKTVLKSLPTKPPARGSIEDAGELVEIALRHRGSFQAALEDRPITISEVYELFKALASVKGEGAIEKRVALLRSVFRRASPKEGALIARILLGDMRAGVAEGVIEEAVIKALGVDHETGEYVMGVLGGPWEAAAIALNRGVEALREVKPQVFKPIKPMLAQQATSPEEALKLVGSPAYAEPKLDGARVQVHFRKGEVRIFSRRRHDITRSFLDVADSLASVLDGREGILEGEIIAMSGERPLPFNVLMRRFRRREPAEEVKVRIYLFDAILLDGDVFIDKSYLERRRTLASVAGEELLVQNTVVESTGDVSQEFRKAVELGYEGLVLKNPRSKYVPGRRGFNWVKLKRALTADLVIVAAEWGYGRRTGWLSNYHLAARDEETGELLVVGKTFKGLTDEEFEEMTRRLLSIKVGEFKRGIVVRPEVVVEVEYDEVQPSPKYRAGIALRLARIKRIREDKSVSEVDTVQELAKQLKVR
ncbi:MAG: hypothetical protein DRN99_01065 [Thermoproteota archaeon]|nr:MAG: hypothetical protein DRN99_01065 [Candidatus Korarchaeota archaeon]